MADMIPASGPADFVAESHEDDIYYALKNKLGDEYRVIHDFHINYLEGYKEKDTQCDFLVFHPKKGFLTIEAKYSRSFQYDPSEKKWIYGSKKIKTDPFGQAEKACRELASYIDNLNLDVFKGQSIKTKCRFIHAVWFHGIKKENITGQLPENAEIKLLMDQSDLLDPEPAINRIYNTLDYKTNLSDEEIKAIFDAIFDCSVDIFTPFNDNDRRLHQEKLLAEQSMALDFIKNQKTVTISGGAGTGKTVLAEMQAKILAKRNPSDCVLFLCYNRKLRRKLEEDMKAYDNILVHNINSFVKEVCNVYDDYKRASELIENMYGELLTIKGKSIKYVIVDEAQDFGKPEIEDALLLENLQEVVVSSCEEGAFYAFYDKLQYVNDKRGKLPPVIENSLCRIPLETNCRNTLQIADIALNPLLLRGDIKKRKNLVLKKNIEGEMPEMVFLKAKSGLSAAVKEQIENLKAEYSLTNSDIVILTLKTLEKSELTDDCIVKKDADGYEDFYYKGVLFTSSAKFKGLEADAVIIVDVDEKTFSKEDSVNNFYVGVTRARLHLSIFACINEEQAKKILTDSFNMEEKKINRNPLVILSSKLNARPSVY